MILKATIIKLLFLFFGGIICSCSEVLEEKCHINYISYRYLNNIGKDATYPYLMTVTDFIFTEDSVLYRVDGPITNGKIAKRPITVPDGEWIIITYANLNGGTKISDYEIGKTRLSEMSLRVASQSDFKGVYSKTSITPSPQFVGNSDRLYYGKVNLNVKGGYTDRIHVVEMSNIHIWINATIKWNNANQAPTKSSSNLHVRLDYVPIVQFFESVDNVDNLYKIPFYMPKIAAERASHITSLLPSSDDEREFSFSTYGLKWETGTAPVLKLYDGETQLLNGKSLDLNKYLFEQGIDHDNTRVQFHQFSILVDGDMISIASFNMDDWQTGILE